MNSFELKKIYINSCFEELTYLKPGNQNTMTNFSSSKISKFREAAKISSDFLFNKELSLGESIFLSAKKCFDSLGSNYNLGIILLCAPIIKSLLKFDNVYINEILKSINENEGDLIFQAIKYSKPGGIKNYSGKGNIQDKIKNRSLNFNDVMKIGSSRDRISRCYIDNYNEIIKYGLPSFKKNKLYHNREKACIFLFLDYLGYDLDSHLQRKHGTFKAEMIRKKSITLKKRLNYKKGSYFFQLRDFDRYLKKLNFNPGTSADLTVTTLLMDKIIDII
ncbi:MAG: hypothetical protein CMN01_03735 [Rickettsiales bacterium]|nr:hypothetical protein [Rickettsiales bacterium]